MQEGKEGIPASQHQITHDKKGFTLKIVPVQKKFRVVYDKRRLLPEGCTLLFDY